MAAHELDHVTLENALELTILPAELGHERWPNLAASPTMRARAVFNESSELPTGHRAKRLSQNRRDGLFRERRRAAA